MAFCPNCGRQMEYIAQYSRYYCHTCRNYAVPRQQQQQQPQPQQQRQRAVVRKVQDKVVPKKSKKPTQTPQTPLDILNERLARGEIDIDTYRQIKKELLNQQDD